MARIYLAALYARHREMELLAETLERDGHIVTSRWIHGLHEMPPGKCTEREANALNRRWAWEDQADLMEADFVLFFSGGGAGRGGRHVEFGLALGLGKQVVVVGAAENCFHFLPVVQTADTFDEAKAWLRLQGGIR